MPKTSPERLEYAKKYREVNKEKIAEWQRGYRARQKEILARNKKIYYETHKDEKAEYDRNYAKLPAKYENYYDKLSPYYNENEIRRDPNNPELFQIRCKYCNNWFNPTTRQAHDRYVSITTGRGGDRELYCSKSCKNACPVYKKQKYPGGFKQNTSREVQPELRKMVLERDNWTCQKCGRNKIDEPELELHCHHIFPLNEDPVGSADTDNCITYCKDCHKEIHMTVPDCNYSQLKC